MMENEVFAELEGRDPEVFFGSLPSPCYVIDEGRLRQNLKVLQGVSERTGAKILLAQKAFSNYVFYPLIAQYLAGTAASGLFEARLGYEQMPGREVHVFSAGYREDVFGELLACADHVVFNSPAQLKRFGPAAKTAGREVGLRINPECSTQKGHAIYDPCAAGSRLGVTRAVWDREMSPELVGMLDGLHFHTLCEQNADALFVTLRAVEEKFGDVLPACRWLNMGGGHHITRADYDIDLLEQCIRSASEKWGVQVYLEPGEAVALNAGYLVSHVLDVVENGDERIAILDTSAACHMPDVIEMPYTPPLHEADSEGAFAYTLGGPTCLSGDIIGKYRFAKPLQTGDMLVFGDMAIYTTCKNNTFNGMPLPGIFRMDESGCLEQIRSFGYEDFRGRL